MCNPFDPGYYGSEELRRFGFASVGENVRVAKNCVIIGLGNIELGDNCRIDSGTRIITSNGFIRLGRYVHIHTNCLLGGRGGITIDDYSGLSHDVAVITATDDFSGQWMFGGTVPSFCTSPKIAPVTIGRHVPIGMKSCILPGVTVGEGAGICVMTMVRNDLEPWTLYQGNPARRIARRLQSALALQDRIEAQGRERAA